MIEAIIFDWYGTLATPNDNDFWNRMPQIIEGAGGRVLPIGEWEASPVEHEAQSLNEETYRAWQANRLMTLFMRSGISEPARTALVEEMSASRYQRLCNIFHDVPHVLSELRNRGLRLGLCSNWDWDLERHLQHNQIHGLFDVIICSASAGFRKPHPRIFKKVIDGIGIRPEHMLFVGDSWSDDVEGSALSGFRPVHVARSECAVREHAGVPCIGDLRALADLV